MIIITVAMQKGGVGKSTLAKSLSVASARDGLMVLALDMDTQQSMNRWGRRRGGDQLPAVRFTTELDLQDELDRARDAGCDVVFIDTPPAKSSEAFLAIKKADLVLIPCTPDIEAFEQLPTTLLAAQGLGTRALAVLNMVTPNSTSEVALARRMFAKAGVEMVDQVLHRLKIHKDASVQGKAAQEVTVISRGSTEISALWKSLAAHLHLCTGAPVHPAGAA
jgi:chromosome partitioning protein